MTAHARTAATRTSKALTVLVILVAVLAAGLAISKRGGDSKLMLQAHFKDASPLLSGNDVRLDGVRVGKVSSVHLDGNNQAIVGLELDSSALPVHSDATVSIRPVSLLGEQYVDLNQGTPSAKVLTDGDEIPTKNTGSAVGLDQVLDTLDAPTSQSLGLLISTLGIGMDGNGKNVAAAVKALAPALKDTQKLTTVLRSQNQTLGQLVDTMSPVAQAMAADNGKDLDALVAAGHELLSNTAANNEALRAMIDELPQTLASARRTLGKLEGAANATAPTLQALRPTTSQLSQISGELENFAGAADPALKSATPVLQRAQTLLERARPVAAALKAAGPAMQSSTTSLLPLSLQLASRFTPVMEFFKGWALTTNGRDGLSHYFRAGLVLTPSAATGLLPSVNGPKGGGDVKGLGDLGVDGVNLGNLLPGLLGQNGLLGTNGLLSGLTDKRSGVTGLTSTQESNALSFLLGGNS